MSDTEQRIRISSTGVEEIDKLIAKNAEVGLSWQELLTLKKLYTAEAKNSVMVTGQETEKSEQMKNGLLQLNGILKDHNIAVGAAHEKYFDLGERLRQFTSVMTFGGLAATQTTSQVVGMTNAAASLGEQFSTMTLSAPAVIGGFIGIGVAAATATFELAEFAKEGAKIELLQSELENMTKGQGGSADDVLKRLREATQGTVSDISLLQKAVQFKAANVFDTDKIIEILKLAHELSDTLPNMSFEEVAQGFVKAEAGAVNRIARQMGLVLDLKKAEDDYALTIGKTNGGQLTEREKKYADSLTLIKEAEAWVGRLGTREDEALHSTERLETAWKNLKSTFSEAATAFTPLFNMVTGIIARIDEGITSPQGKLLMDAMGGILAPFTIPGQISSKISAARKQYEQKYSWDLPTMEIPLPPGESSTDTKKQKDFMDKLRAEATKAEHQAIEDKYRREVALLDDEEKLKIEEAKAAGVYEAMNEDIHKAFIARRQRLDQDAAASQRKQEDAEFQKEFEARNQAFEKRIEQEQKLHERLLEIRTTSMESGKVSVFDRANANIKFGLNPQIPVGGMEVPYAQMGQQFPIAQVGQFGNEASKIAKVTFGEWMTEGAAFTRSLQNGFTQATSYLAEGFVRAFNLGDNLLGRFVGAFMSSLAGALIGRAVGFMLGKPSLGVGATPSGGTFAGVRAGDIAVGGNLAASMAPPIYVSQNITSDGMALIVQQGNRVLSHRVIG